MGFTFSSSNIMFFYLIFCVWGPQKVSSQVILRLTLDTSTQCVEEEEEEGEGEEEGEYTISRIT